MNTIPMPTFYDIVKQYKGGLFLDLPAFDSSAINKQITIPYNGSKVRVPRIYALGIFVDPTLEKMYRAGMFTVEPAKVFEEEVKNIFFPIEDKVEAIPEAEIVEALQKGNRKFITDNLKAGSVNKENIILLARDNIGSMSVSMIRDLEKMLEVELIVEEADGVAE